MGESDASDDEAFPPPPPATLSPLAHKSESAPAKMQTPIPIVNQVVRTSSASRQSASKPSPDGKAQVHDAKSNDERAHILAEKAKTGMRITAC